jgi:hypothetical protein
MAPQPNSGPGLPLWGFVTITFLQGWIVSPAPNPQPGGPVVMTPGDRVAQLYPQVLGTLFSRLLRHVKHIHRYNNMQQNVRTHLWLCARDSYGNVSFKNNALSTINEQQSGDSCICLWFL